MPSPNEQHSSSPSSRLGVLRHVHFRRIVIAGFVSNVGGWMELLGVQIIIAHATGSLTALGTFGAAGLTPILLFGVLGGLLADRVNRKKLLVFTQAMLMVVAGCLAAVSHMDPAKLGHVSIPWLSIQGEHSGFIFSLFVLTVFQGTIMAFNIPAWQVLTPRLVPKDELTKAITVNGIQFNAARVIGPAIAGAVMGWYGSTPLFVMNTLTFLGVLLAVSTTPDAPAPPRSGNSALVEVRQAWGFIFNGRGPLCVFLAIIAMGLLAAPLIRILPLYPIDVYKLGQQKSEQVTGYLIGALGLGAVLGGVLLRYLPKWYPKHHFIPATIAGCGLTISLFALTKSPWTGYSAMILAGVFWIWSFNSAWAAMQGLVPDHMRGRILAVTNVAAFGSNAVGNVLSGLLGDTIAMHTHNKALGTQLAIGLLSVSLLIAGIVMMIWRVPEVDGLPRLPAGTRVDRSLLNAILAREHRPARDDFASAAANPENRT